MLLRYPLPSPPPYNLFYSARVFLVVSSFVFVLCSRGCGEVPDRRWQVPRPPPRPFPRAPRAAMAPLRPVGPPRLPAHTQLHQTVVGRTSPHAVVCDPIPPMGARLAGERLARHAPSSPGRAAPGGGCPRGARPPPRAPSVRRERGSRACAPHLALASSPLVERESYHGCCCPKAVATGQRRPRLRPFFFFFVPFTPASPAQRLHLPSPPPPPPPRRARRPPGPLAK